MCLHFSLELAKLILSLEKVQIPDTTYPPRDFVCLFRLLFFLRIYFCFIYVGAST